jgi:hypothetical protein
MLLREARGCKRMRSGCPTSRSRRNANPGSLVQNAHSCSTVSIIWEAIFGETLVALGVTESLQTELTSSGR